MKIICVGRNYTEHIKELDNERPSEPVIFIKPDTAVLGKGQDFHIPYFSDDIHYETEILIKINKVGKHIAPRFAPNYYDEISLGIDFTARDMQRKLKEKGLPWEKAKGFDGAALIGTWLPKTTFKDINAINFSLSRNGKRVQQGNTALMLWKTDALVAHISTYFTLKKGDIIFTGTPAGVGKIASGDYLEGYIEEEQCFAVRIK
ncbi:MAG: fumarylacetoacetate hydrolase family protein [Bacteroidota bacterium]